MTVTEAEAKACATKTAADGRCEGGCEMHSGPVELVHVTNWGWFSYCQAAQAEDKKRGLTVTKD